MFNNNNKRVSDQWNNNLDSKGVQTALTHLKNVHNAFYESPKGDVSGEKYNVWFLCCDFLSTLQMNDIHQAGQSAKKKN